VRVRAPQLGPRQRETGVAFQRLLQVRDPLRHVLARGPVDEMAGEQMQSVRLGIGRAAARRARHRDRGIVAVAAAEQRATQLLHDRLSDVVLHREDVVQRAVVGLRPQRRALGDVDELHRDPHAVAGLAHAAVEHGRHVQLARDLRDVVAAVLELERRCARRHAQPRHLRQHVQQLVGQTLGEVLVVGAGAAIRERQHRDGRDTRRCGGRLGRLRQPAQRVRQLARARVARGRLLLETAADDRAQCVRQIGTQRLQ